MADETCLSDSFDAYAADIEQKLLQLQQSEEQWRQQANAIAIEQLSNEQAKEIFHHFAKYAQTPDELSLLLSALTYVD